MFLVDGGGVADTSTAIMRERQQLSEEGMFIVIARINAQNGALLSPPDVISRGFVDPQAQNGLVDESIGVVTQTLEKTASGRVTDWSELKNAIRRDLSTFLSQRTRKRPIILPLIVEV
jgi:ribonuclease J